MYVYRLVLFHIHKHHLNKFFLVRSHSALIRLIVLHRFIGPSIQSFFWCYCYHVIRVTFPYVLSSSLYFFLDCFSFNYLTYFKKTFPRFNRNFSGGLHCILCVLRSGCTFILSISVATSRLICGGTIPPNTHKLYFLVDFKHPVIHYSACLFCGSIHFFWYVQISSTQAKHTLP